MYRGSRRLSFLPELRGYNNRVLWEGGVRRCRPDFVLGTAKMMPVVR